jgi:hypothetical protein
MARIGPPRLRGAKAIHRRGAEKVEEAQRDHRLVAAPTALRNLWMFLLDESSLHIRR